jgi:SAM-dependent methyltransferase
MEVAPEELKQFHRTMWAAGHFDAIAQLVWDVGEKLSVVADVEPGMTVLDVACGTGNASIAAALAGAEVTGLDLTPELLDDARRNADEAGVEIEWIHGDAEALPFADGKFDRVLSTFGVMFAPRHEVAAGELARVTAPGGAIGLCNWTPEGLVGQMFRTVASRLPTPPSYAKPPVLWGDEHHVERLLEPHDIELEFQRADAVVRGESLEAFVQHFEDNFGPWHMAKAALGDAWPELRAELTEIYANANTASDGTMVGFQEYLIVLGTKAD